MTDAIRVTVEVVPWLTDYFDHRGQGRLRLQEKLSPGATVLELVRQLAQCYPTFAQEALQDGELGGHVAVLLNNRWLQPSGNLNAVLRDGDTVTLLPAFAGGREEVRRR